MSVPAWFGQLPESAQQALPVLGQRSIREGLPFRALVRDLASAVTERPLEKYEAEDWMATWWCLHASLTRLRRMKSSQGFVEAVQFMAIVDSRVSNQCQARDGLLLSMKSLDLWQHVPPLHWGCRSILSPVSGYRLQQLGGAARLEADRLGWEAAPAAAPGFGLEMNVESTLAWMECHR